VGKNYEFRSNRWYTLSAYNINFFYSMKVGDLSLFLCADYENVTGNIPSSPFSLQNSVCYMRNKNKYENVLITQQKSGSEIGKPVAIDRCNDKYLSTIGQEIDVLLTYWSINCHVISGHLSCSFLTARCMLVLIFV